MAEELDKSMSDLDREIAARLRTALDDVEPDAAATSRMLTALKDAEAMRKVQENPSGRAEATDAGSAPSAPKEAARTARPQPRMKVWKVAAPIAAVLVVAAIGFGLLGQGGQSAGPSESATNVAAEAVSEDSYDAAASDYEAMAGSASGETVLEMDSEPAPLAEMAAQDKALTDEGLADAYSFVTLDDGTELAVDADEVADGDLIGELVAKTSAFDETGAESTSCTVYEYEGSDDYAVVYDDDPAGEAHLAHPAQ